MIKGFIVLYPKNDFLKMTIREFNNKEDMLDFLEKLRSRNTILGQSYLEFSSVFAPGSTLPVTEIIKKGLPNLLEERKDLVKSSLPEGFFVQRTKNGRIISEKIFEFQNEIEDRAQDWILNGETITILNLRESNKAEFIYNTEIEPIWGGLAIV